DREHMDCCRDMEDIEQTFVEFMERVPFYAIVVACNDDDRLRSLLPRVTRRLVTYGRRDDSVFRIADAGVAGGTCLTSFRVVFGGRDLGEFRLNVPGAHNVLNATAAIAVGVGLDVATDEIRSALESFRGVDRRFQLRGRAAGVSVIDDYGHHPTEIRATLAAARQCGFRRVHVIFQPHRYTRTQALLDEFATAFADADTLFILDIYAASEQPIPGITAEVLARRISERGGKPARYMRSFADAGEAALAAAEPGDMLLTLGAGNVYQLGPMLVERLQSREEAEVQHGRC